MIEYSVSGVPSHLARWKPIHLSVDESPYTMGVPEEHFAMVTRLAVAQVPIWQPFFSLTGVILTSYLMLQLAGRFFQAGNLLSAAPFQLRRMLTGWRD